MSESLTDDFETEADGWTADDLVEIENDHPLNTCNGFAFSYLEANPDHDVVVADGIWKSTGGMHCYVVDRTLGVVIDMTTEQFIDGTFGAVWDGEEHPHIQADSVRTWTDRDEFEAFYGDDSNAHNAPYIV